MTASGSPVPAPGTPGNSDDGDAGAPGSLPARLPHRLASRYDTVMRWLYRRIHSRGRVVLLLYGLLLGCVGLADTYGGLDLSAKMIGVFLTVAAIIIVGSCIVALAAGTPAHAAPEGTTLRGSGRDRDQ